jgi:RecF protein
VHLIRLALTDFRSYPSVDVALGPGVTIFSGPNGEGKTNLVEAVGYVATLASHRVAHDAPMIRQGAERAIVRASVHGAVSDTLIEIELNPGRANRVRLNRAPVTKPREILGLLRTVLFAPEDLALVKGDPGERRRFLDDLLVAMAPRYAGIRADYDRVLRQRTALLKSAGPKATRAGKANSRETVMSTLDVWDAHLARAGAELLVAREHLVAALRPHVESAYSAVAGEQGPATIDYRRSFGTAATLRSGQQGDEPDSGGGAARTLAPPAPPAPPAPRAGPAMVTGCGTRSPPCERRSPRSGTASWTAACAWPDRIATSSSSGSAGCPRAATPATASRGRWRWRSGWPASTCCEAAQGGRTRC